MKKREQRWSEQAERLDAAQRSRPRLRFAIFENIWFRLDDHIDEIEQIKEELKWDDDRLALFEELVLDFREAPTIERYLHIRRHFSEVEIIVARFNGVGPLMALRSIVEAQGIDLELLGGAMAGRERDIDALSLQLFDRIVAKDKLPKDGPGSLNMRRNAISDALIDYLVVIMMESHDWSDGLSRVPASLIMLARHRLCGMWPDLYKEYLALKRRIGAALLVGRQLQPGEPLSVSKLANMTSVPRSTAARWLGDEAFEDWVEFGRKLERRSSGP